jgi:integrase
MVEKLSKTVISKRKSSERKPKSELESKSFRDGAIYLFKRADYVKPTWFCRVKIPGAKGYISQSTKTTDEHLAFKFADDLYLKGLAEVASGRDISSKKVSVAINEFIDGYSEAEKKKPTAITRSKFLTHTATFFGNRRLKEVNTKVLAELNDWIVENSRTGILSPNTIKRYTTDLKQFFNWCYERSYIDALPRFPKLKTESNRRPHFDQKDWAKLTRHLQEFIKTNIPKVARDRKMLRDYVLILANTGIRVGEARNLKWKDLKEIPSDKGSNQSPNIALYVKGKTGAREVVARTAEVRTYFKRLLELRTAELGKKRRHAL